MRLNTQPEIHKVYQSGKLPTKDFMEFYLPQLQVLAEASDTDAGFTPQEYKNHFPNRNVDLDDLSLSRTFVHDKNLHPRFCVNPDLSAKDVPSGPFQSGWDPPGL